jgi:hypothetical protein
MTKDDFDKLFDIVFVDAVKAKYAQVSIPSDETMQASWEAVKQRMSAAQADHTNIS